MKKVINKWLGIDSLHKLVRSQQDIIISQQEIIMSQQEVLLELMEGSLIKKSEKHKNKKLATENKKPEDSTLDLWTTEPPIGTAYYYVTHYGDTDWCVRKGYEWDNFRLKTGNCHKTSESAKEALKRLLEK